MIDQLPKNFLPNNADKWFSRIYIDSSQQQRAAEVQLCIKSAPYATLITLIGKMSDLQIELVDYIDSEAEIKKIRQTVFQEEQGVAPQLEFDGQDAIAQHLLAYVNGEAVGTTRIRKISTHKAKIERLAVLKSVRKQRIGTKLMEKALLIANYQGYTEVLVHAQEYIKELYTRLGFEQVGSPFEEAGIPHVKMIKKLEKD